MKIKLGYVLVLTLLLIGCGGYTIQEQKEEPIKEPVEMLNVSTMSQEEAEEKESYTDKDSELSLEEKIEHYMEKMTVEEKIGQLLMIAIRQDEEGNPITEINTQIIEQFKSYPVGGVIFFKENIVDREQTKQLICGLQALQSIPLFIGVDEEGGKVSRIGSNPALCEVPFKEAYALGQTGDVQQVKAEAKRMGRLLKDLGINMDFAPVADLYNEPSNTVIGRRSFSSKASEAIPMVIAFAKGLEEEGIVPVVKHFPGHGNTKEDSHSGRAYVNKTLEELEKEELLPFAKAIEEGVGGLMKGHLMVEAVDAVYPVSLSEKWGEYMREYYDTEKILIITDALNMGAIANEYSPEEVAILCLKAGNDILLMPENLSRTFEALVNAYKDGILTEERLNKSVKKILLKKVSQNMLILE